MFYENLRLIRKKIFFFSKRIIGLYKNLLLIDFFGELRCRIDHKQDSTGFCTGPFSIHLSTCII